MGGRDGYRSGRFVLSAVLKLILIVAVFAMGALYFVWLKNKVMALGREISLKEQRLAELQRANEQLRNQILVLQTPAMIEAKVRELRLGLLPPGPWQEVYVLPEPGPEEIDIQGSPRPARQTATIVP